MYGGGLGEKEVIQLSQRWDEIEPQLDKGEKIVQVHVPPRLKNRAKKSYYTLIGGDALATLKEYLAKERGVVRAGESIFVNDKGNPLTIENVQNMFKKYAMHVGIIRPVDSKCPVCGNECKRVRHGIEIDGKKRFRTFLRCLTCGKESILTEEQMRPRTTRYRVHSHEIRDLFRSEWQKSGADPIIAKFFMGHQIDPNGYNKCTNDLSWVKSQYLTAIPFLNVLSQEPRTVPKTDLKELEEENRVLKERVGRLERAIETRSQSDEVMNMLFQDPAFLATLKERLKTLS
jgi:hypothetical protein